MKNKFFTSLALQDIANIVPAAMQTSLHDKFAGYRKAWVYDEKIP